MHAGLRFESADTIRPVYSKGMRRLSFLTAAIALSGAMALSAQAPERGLRRTDAQTGRRVALVIGNDTYPGAALRNGRNDARAVADALRALGFSTTLLEDATQAAMGGAIAELGDSLGPDDAVFFFFAGHGVAVGGENYLIPVDYRGTSEAGARFGALAASQIQEAFGRGKVSMIVLDACRNNPYASQRAGGGGLAAMEARGSLIAFATGAGQMASDNPGASNGLFTQELLTVLAEPNMNARDAFYRIRQRVYAASNGRQFPAVYDGLLGDFVFRPGAAAPAGAGAPADSAAIGAELTNSSANPAPAVSNAGRVTTSAGRGGIAWVSIPGGDGTAPWRAEFDMGCVPTDRGCDGDENRHRVTLTRPFALTATEVTVGQVRAAGIGLPPESNANADERLPVLNLTRYKAAEVCAQLEGRLPTEAEWEYAARGGLRDALYPWGDLPPTCQAGTINGAHTKSCGVKGARPVGQFRPNAYGLFDMAGNAQEWVADWFTRNLARQGTVDPVGPTQGSGAHVFRGGSSASDAGNVRVSSRDIIYDTGRSDTIGFRCARNMP